MGIVNITADALAGIFTGYNTFFNKGFNEVPVMWDPIAMEIKSTGADEAYGWLEAVPAIREWVGDRVLRDLKAGGMRLANKPYEGSFSVKREQIEDDKAGMFNPVAERMGREMKLHPDKLLWPLLQGGWAAGGECWDGQYFFSTSHPIITAAGAESTQANTDNGSDNEGWFLVDPNQFLKPLILQRRKDPVFVSKTKEDDERVFMKNEFAYGCDDRKVVGYGFYQSIWGSKQALTATYYAAALAGLRSMKDNQGNILGMLSGPKKPLLIVPPDKEASARALLFPDADASGYGNPWKDTADLLVSSWLA